MFRNRWADPCAIRDVDRSRVKKSEELGRSVADREPRIIKFLIGEVVRRVANVPGIRGELSLQNETRKLGTLFLNVL